MTYALCQECKHGEVVFDSWASLDGSIVGEPFPNCICMYCEARDPQWVRVDEPPLRAKED
jgi:hypothetical protein